jgi:hypothetical protein
MGYDEYRRRAAPSCEAEHATSKAEHATSKAAEVYQEGEILVNPQTGERVQLVRGKWKPIAKSSAMSANQLIDVERAFLAAHAAGDVENAKLLGNEYVRLRAQMNQKGGPLEPVVNATAPAVCSEFRSTESLIVVWFFAVASTLPWLWYFLLRRLSEVISAVRGKPPER